MITGQIIRFFDGDQEMENLHYGYSCRDYFHIEYVHKIFIDNVYATDGLDSITSRPIYAENSNR